MTPDPTPSREDAVLALDEALHAGASADAIAWLLRSVAKGAGTPSTLCLPLTFGGGRMFGERMYLDRVTPVSAGGSVPKATDGRKQGAIAMVLDALRDDEVHPATIEAFVQAARAATGDAYGSRVFVCSFTQMSAFASHARTGPLPPHGGQ